MGTSHDAKKRFEPVGPFEPPLPDEAMKGEGTREEPMAVAEDKGHSPESFRATTQDKDQMSRGVQQAWRDPNLKKQEGHHAESSRDEDAARQKDTPGYHPAGHGEVEMDTEEDA